MASNTSSFHDRDEIDLNKRVTFNLIKHIRFNSFNLKSLKDIQKYAVHMPSKTLMHNAFFLKISDYVFTMGIMIEQTPEKNLVHYVCLPKSE